MELKTRFEIGDKAFVLNDGKCYAVKVLEIDIEVGKDGAVEIEYKVEQAIPTGLLSEDTTRKTYDEDELFLSKQEVKEKIEANEKIVKDYEELKGMDSNTDFHHMWTTAARAGRAGRNFY